MVANYVVFAHVTWSSLKTLVNDKFCQKLNKKSFLCESMYMPKPSVDWRHVFSYRESVARICERAETLKPVVKKRLHNIYSLNLVQLQLITLCYILTIRAHDDCKRGKGISWDDLLHSRCWIQTELTTSALSVIQRELRFWRRYLLSDSIPDDAIGISLWFYSSGSKKALEWTQPLREMSSFCRLQPAKRTPHLTLWIMIKQNFPAGQPQSVRYNLRKQTTSKLLTYRRERENFYCMNTRRVSTSEHTGLHYNIGSCEHTLLVTPLQNGGAVCTYSKTHFMLLTSLFNNIPVVLIYSCLSI